MRLLVTGGAGFIGSNFVHHWVREHPRDHVVVYDALTYAGNRANLTELEGAIGFVHADIGDLDTVGATLRAHRIDVVGHFLAESHLAAPPGAAAQPDHRRATAHRWD